MMDDNRIRAALKAQTSDVTVPEHLWSQIVCKARTRKSRVATWLVPAAIAVGVLLLTASPSMRVWAARNLPMVGTYIERWSQVEKGWAWAENHEGFQEVLAERHDNGYTLRVHRVLADPTQTTLIYSVEGKDPHSILPKPQDLRFNGNRFNWGLSGRGEVIDGVLVGSIEFDPIPADTGNMELVVRQIGQTKGRWDVGFSVSRAPLTSETRSISVGRPFSVPGGELSVEELVLAPTQMVARIRYYGSEHAPDLRGTSIITPDGQMVERRGGSGSGRRQSDGTWEQTYTLEFQRLDPLPASVILRLAGLVYREGETRLSVEAGYTTIAPDGREVVLEGVEVKGRDGRVTIQFPIDNTNPAPLDVVGWMVVDDTGQSHHTRLLSQQSNSSQAVPIVTGTTNTQMKRQEVQWMLPSGRKPVALINPGYWEYIQDLGEVTIQIPPQ